MNDVTEEIASKLRDMLEPLVLTGEIGSSVGFVPGDKPIKMTDNTYWASEQTRDRFERRLVEEVHKAGSLQMGFGCALILADRDDEMLMRPPNPNYPPTGEEIEIMWLLVVDLAQGIDICRVDIDRINGNVSFGQMLVLEGDVGLLTGAPGGAAVAGVAG